MIASIDASSASKCMSVRACACIVHACAAACYSYCVRYKRYNERLQYYSRYSVRDKINKKTYTYVRVNLNGIGL